jgi:hypothetical protein
MPFTELYVDQSGASVNGGSSAGAAKLTLTSCVTIALISGHVYTLTNTAATGWGSTAVGDFLTYATSTWMRVLELSYGGNAQVIRAEPANESASLTGTNQTTVVGGAWNLLGSASPYLAQATATTWINMGLAAVPPRVNCKKEASNYAETGAFNTYGTWSVVVPLRIEGYETSIGDISWQSNEKWATFDWGTSACHGVTLAAFCHIFNIALEHDQSGAYYPLNTTAQTSTMRNCKVKRTAGAGNAITGQLSGTHVRCTFETNQDHTVPQVVGFTAARFINCLLRSTATMTGGSAGGLLTLTGANGVVDGCLLVNSCVGTSLGASATGSVIKNNVFYKMRQNGINVNGDAIVASLIVANNIFEELLLYGLYSAATTGAAEFLACENNAYFNLGSGWINTANLSVSNASNVALASSPFVDAANGNFNLKDNTLSRAGMTTMMPGTVNVVNECIGALGYSYLPAAPTLSITISGTTATATITAGVMDTVNLYQKSTVSPAWVLAGTRVGSGTIAVAGLSPGMQYVMVAIATDGNQFSFPSPAVMVEPQIAFVSALDQAVVAAADPILAAFGRPCTYLPKAGGSRAILAVVRPQAVSRLPGGNYGTTTGFMIQVKNSVTGGISVQELDTGGDRIRLENPVGGSTQDRRISRIERQDTGMLYLVII